MHVPTGDIELKNDLIGFLYSLLFMKTSFLQIKVPELNLLKGRVRISWQKLCRDKARFY
jgi:hypothetical protein